MEQNNIADVWAEIKNTDEGISISLYSEGESGVRVEDEFWRTWDELERETGSLESVRLSESSRDLLRSDSQSYHYTPSKGDVLIDDNSPEWSEDNRVEVVEVLQTVRTDEYIIQSKIGEDENVVIPPEEQTFYDVSVANVNSSYSNDDYVIRGKYLDGPDKTYAFPASRLVTGNMN